jgi:hypothetical protein
MPNPVDTKTVRIAGEAATQLQTIAALKDQMGQRFKPVEFLNGLVEKPIADLYESTVAEFTEFQARSKKKRPRS